MTLRVFQLASWRIAVAVTLPTLVLLENEATASVVPQPGVEGSQFECVVGLRTDPSETETKYWRRAFSSLRASRRHGRRASQLFDARCERTLSAA